MNQLTFSNKQETVKMVIVSLPFSFHVSVRVCVCSFAYITLYWVEPCGSIASKALNLKKFSFINRKYHLEPKVRPVVCWVIGSYSNLCFFIAFCFLNLSPRFHFSFPKSMQVTNMYQLTFSNKQEIVNVIIISLEWAIHISILRERTLQKVIIHFGTKSDPY